VVYNFILPMRFIAPKIPYRQLNIFYHPDIACGMTTIT
jgi:hypothetical protein